MASWQISGDYMETCNCTLLCPCITSNLTAQPTDGDCKVAIAMRIDKGDKDGVKLDGLSFIVVMHAPGAMADGNIAVGLVIDERALAAAGGRDHGASPPARPAARWPLWRRWSVASPASSGGRSRFDSQGLKRSVRAGELVDQACEGLASATAPGEALGVDNTVHPVNTRLSLAKATRSRIRRLRRQVERFDGHAQRPLRSVRLGRVTGRASFARPPRSREIHRSRPGPLLVQPRRHDPTYRCFAPRRLRQIAPAGRGHAARQGGGGGHRAGRGRPARPHHPRAAPGPRLPARVTKRDDDPARRAGRGRRPRGHRHLGQPGGCPASG